MAKKAKATKRDTLEDPTESVDSANLVRLWAEDHACDRFAIHEVGKDKFRVNLYSESGDIIRVSHLTRSFYLVVNDGIVEDKTIKRTS